MTRSPRFHEAMVAYNEDNMALAMQLMEECARDGDPVACYMLASFYSESKGSRGNKAHVEKWLARFEELAEDGNAEAQLSRRNTSFAHINIDSKSRVIEYGAEMACGRSGYAIHSPASCCRCRIDDDIDVDRVEGENDPAIIVLLQHTGVEQRVYVTVNRFHISIEPARQLA